MAWSTKKSQTNISKFGAFAMTVQLRSIAIYSHHSKCREVKFKTNSLNILTGVAKRGKSALLEIVDYCWGRDKCYIPHGEIRSKVSWFAIHLDCNNEGVIVARKNPNQNNKGLEDIYFKKSVDSLPEDSNQFYNTIDLDELRIKLAELLGFPENFNLTEIERSRNRAIASAENAILFCLQKQSEIASNQLLFHRQNEPKIPATIREVLPFYLGILSSQEYLSFERLQDVEKNLSNLLAEKNKSESLIADKAEVSKSLLDEAIRTGLINDDAEIINEKDTYELLEKVMLSPKTGNTIVAAPNESIQELRSQHAELQHEYIHIERQINETKAQIKEINNFEFETKEQISRLDSINLFDKADESDTQCCPLCEQELSKPIPTIREINVSLDETTQQLNLVEKDKSRFIKLLEKLESEKSQKAGKIQQIQEIISGRIERSEELQRENSFLTEQARVAGKIALFMGRIKKYSFTELDEQIENLSLEKVVLKELSMSQESIKKLPTSNLNLINKTISDYAKELKLEYSEGNLKFDSNKLTIIADHKNEQTKLNEMGGAANFVGYHISVSLALHKHFVEINSPVPRFLIFDQPSQVHYPPEQKSPKNSQKSTDDDQIAVKNLYKFIYDYCKKFNPNIQVIIIDHVHLKDNWFKNSISEIWREDGRALVPENWPTLAELKAQPSLIDQTLLKSM